MWLATPRLAALALIATVLVGCGGTVGMPGPPILPTTPGPPVESAPQLPAGVDPMTALSQRPIELPVMDANAPCVGTSSKDLGATAPNYGFGLGPGYLSGQMAWYSNGQVAIVMVDARYAGPLLVRGVELSGGPSTITLVGFDTALPLIVDKERRRGVNVVTAVPISGAGLYLEAVPASSFWRASIGMLSTSGPGCFGLQMDGDTFTELIVFAVEAGKPPPG